MKNFIKIISIIGLFIATSGFAQEKKTNETKKTPPIEVKKQVKDNLANDSIAPEESYTEHLKSKQRKFRIKPNSRSRNRKTNKRIDEVKKAFEAERRMQKNKSKKDNKMTAPKKQRKIEK